MVFQGSSNVLPHIGVVYPEMEPQEHTDLQSTEKRLDLGGSMHCFVSR